MKFIIGSTNWCGDSEKLLKYYPFLREYGFETTEVNNTRPWGGTVKNHTYM